MENYLEMNVVIHENGYNAQIIDQARVLIYRLTTEL